MSKILKTIIKLKPQIINKGYLQNSSKVKSDNALDKIVSSKTKSINSDWKKLVKRSFKKIGIDLSDMIINIITISLLLGVSAISIKKIVESNSEHEPIKKVKKALLLKKTATWCPYCGDWGTEFSTKILNTYPNCTIIGIHFGSLKDTTNFLLHEAVDSSRLPHFFLGTKNIENNFEVLSDAVNDELKSESEAFLSIESNVKNNLMNISVWYIKGDTWAPNNKYQLAVYILENKLIVPQKNRTTEKIDNNFVHNNVLRAEASNLSFGIDIEINDDINSQKFNVDLKKIVYKNLDNCNAVAVIWKKTQADQLPIFINCT
jgi:hypothetical protein